jgi:nucleotide-binding universal stress UspA family protein
VPLDNDHLDTCLPFLDTDWPAPYTHILVPTDFGVAAAYALHKALALAQQHGAAVTVLHVLPRLSSMIAIDIDHASADIVTQILDEIYGDALSRLTALLPRQTAHPLHSQIVAGDTAMAILQAARRCRADLMVMGKPRRRVGWRVLGRNVARTVVRRAPCPVLLVEALARYELVKA